MDSTTSLITSLLAAFWVLVLALIFVVVRRIRNRQTENLMDRLVVTHKQFSFIVPLILVLGVAFYLSADSFSNPDAPVLNVLSVVRTKCGQNAQLFDLLMGRGFSGYAFTPGNCASGSKGEFVRIYYDSRMHSIGSPEVTANRGDSYDFPRHITNPISFQDWKMNSDEALAIARNTFWGNTLSPNEQLELYTSDGSLVWEYDSGNNLGVTKVVINATTGRVLSRGGQPMYFH